MSLISAILRRRKEGKGRQIESGVEEGGGVRESELEPQFGSGYSKILIYAPTTAPANLLRLQQEKIGISMLWLQQIFLHRLRIPVKWFAPGLRVRVPSK